MSTESPGKDQNLEYLGEIKNKIKVTQMTYYLTYRVLIDAKKPEHKSIMQVYLKARQKIDMPLRGSPSGCMYLYYVEC
jgi:hypothetical protein